MIYLSQLIGRSILSKEGEAVATINDVVVLYGKEDYAPVIGLVAKYRRRLFFNSCSNLKEISLKGATLRSDVLDLTPFSRRNGEILLAKDVLDKQLIDIDGKRVVRVNDVQIFGAGTDWRVSGADVSFQGFVRRLLPTGFYGSKRPVEVIDWADVGYLATDSKTVTVNLKSSKDKLARLHPVEIAQLAQELSPLHWTDIVDSLDDEIAADTLEEMSTENQVRVLEELDEERAADLLEEMSPDDAVDVLEEMDDEKAHELFELMEEDEKVDVAELMTYEKDSAGGLMTTEMVTFSRSMKVGDVLGELRTSAETPNMIYYVYVVDKPGSKKLCGLATLRSIILSDQESTLGDIMRGEFRSAHPDDSGEEVALRIAEYNLLALPVVDDDRNIVGIVTVDDAMEILLPKRFD